jgi:predicted nuclease of predicted toxin-antitoxin system
VVRLTEIAAADTPDRKVLSLALERSLVLLTNDKDFSNILRYPPSSHTGIVVLRMRAANEARVHRTLLSLLADHSPESLSGSLAVVSGGKYRLRR